VLRNFQGLWIFLVFVIRPRPVRSSWIKLLTRKGGLDQTRSSTHSWSRSGNNSPHDRSRKKTKTLGVGTDDRRFSALSSTTVSTVRPSDLRGRNPSVPSSSSSTQSPTVSLKYRYSPDADKAEGADVTETSSKTPLDDAASS